jgi:hypothetical protein
MMIHPKLFPIVLIVLQACAEAADVLAAGGGEYFRRFAVHAATANIRRGDWVWYVEDGYLRGRCQVTRVVRECDGRQCATTGRYWMPGFYVFMDSRSWQWIEPLAMKGFQGFRYVHPRSLGELLCAQVQQATFLGGWRDPRPEVGS